jgi:hypothetical protein
MKKIVLLMFLIAFASVGSAQKISADTRSTFYLGPKLGYNFANVFDTQGEEFEAKTKIGFAAGVFFTIPFGRFIGIQPEILFSQKGFRATGILLGNSYELKRTTTFIDIPLLISIKPATFISIMAGPQFSYLIKQRDEFTGNAVNAEQEQEFNSDNIRKNIVCFLSGIDFNFNKIVLGARVGWDIQHNTGDGTSTTPRYKNVWAQATVGIRF